jgi:hypothetical protein
MCCHDQVSLLIKAIGPGDEGEYTCTALNPYGEVGHSAPEDTVHHHLLLYSKLVIFLQTPHYILLN